ncbi:MAG TPA: hypothetical protein ACFCUY_16195 [Xenococcaceae cyanobacterium]
MNTPSHYVLNLALLGKTVAPQENIAITIGALLPDIPIFVFYFITKFVYKIPEAKIWTEVYYEPGWQNIVALSHSIPLAIIGLVICLYLDWQSGIVLCLSIICHCLLDLPVHNNDAHRHFFPFSNYRFISPFSYWDVNHYGKWVAAVEILLVLGVNPLVIGLLKSSFTKGIIIIIDFIYLYFYYKFYWQRI